MDKNQGIGIVLLFLVFVAYFNYTKPTPEELERIEFVQDSIEQAKLLEKNPNAIPATTTAQTDVVLPDSIKKANLSRSYGSFSEAMIGESSIVSLDNELITINFDTKGGHISSAILKKHFKITEDENHNQTKNALALLEDEKNKFEYLIPTTSNGNVNSSDLYFTPNTSGNTLTLTANLGQDKSIKHVFTLKDNSYHLDYRMDLEGFDQFINSNNPNLKFKWHNYLDRIELNTKFEQYYTTVYYKEVNEDSDYCNCRSDDIANLEGKRVEWVSNVNQFFNSSLIAENVQFENSTYETVALDIENEDLKLLKSEFDVPLNLSRNETIEFGMYIGPNEFKRLKAYDNGLEEIIPFGRSLFGTINRWVIRPAFNWLSSFIGSKGVVIIVLIFIIKMLLYPLMYKMLHSQAKMGALKPELAALKEKYKDDKQKVQMETMKIYREYGVSPLGGCMPMILQMPIWYALFRFFPASITFRQEPFLWAKDLSSFDVIAWLPNGMDIPAFGSHISLFTILWAISTVAYSYYNMKHMDMSANPAMKYVQYLMPITFLFFFNGYASGLTCYMFFSNLFNIAQTLVTKKFVFKEDKLREELMAAKSKPKKKGGFQNRLEEAMKQQQEVQAKRKGQLQKKKRKR
ncbi:MAG: membrane protein insertase YidC [Saprospiraceae bacterium]|nr:membrane protein insertase YidC [Bacteroidia bacterium]NNE15302.1 membrane protein insertase YidC [Saprospiraceae bacterium]NNL91566.1 membrane protein insertase YidC [Saprospiraceae bacterium]